MYEKEIRWLIEEKYGGVKTAEAKIDIRKLEAGEHVSYVIGFVDFLGTRIDLDERPLIPRPETEFWVGEAIKELKKTSTSIRVMDAFAGSGCVGIAVLTNLSNVRVDFLEENTRFLRQIKHNLIINSIDASRATLITSDVFSGATGLYDAIFANPPYVNESLTSESEKRQLSAEPREAIYAPSEGLYYVERVLSEARLFLKSPGILYCEIGEDQSEPALRYRKLYRQFAVMTDQYGRSRYVRAVI